MQCGFCTPLEVAAGRSGWRPKNDASVTKSAAFYRRVVTCIKDFSTPKRCFHVVTSKLIQKGSRVAICGPTWGVLHQCRNSLRDLFPIHINGGLCKVQHQEHALILLLAFRQSLKEVDHVATKHVPHKAHGQKRLILLARHFFEEVFKLTLRRVGLSWHAEAHLQPSQDFCIHRPVVCFSRLSNSGSKFFVWHAHNKLRRCATWRGVFTHNPDGTRHLRLFLSSPLAMI